MGRAQLDRQSLHGQFLLTQDPTDSPRQWAQSPLGSWTLCPHPEPEVHLHTRGRNIVTALMGHLIDRDGHLLSGSLPAEASFDTPAAFECFLYAHGGRFAAVVVTEDFARVYLDPAGTLACVYDPERYLVGSTLSVSPAATGNAESFILDEGETPPIDHLPSNGYYPAGLTSHNDIYRLLPNHYLNLETFEATRHWPSQQLETASPEEIPKLVERITGAVTRTIHALAESGPVYFHLTAGRDSRLLLACSKAVKDRLSFVTIDYSTTRSRKELRDSGQDVDRAAAAHLATKLKLNYRFLPAIQSSEVQKRWFLFREGYSGHPGKAEGFLLPAMKHLNSHGAAIYGFSGDTAKAPYHKRALPNTSPCGLFPGVLCSVALCPPSARNMEAVGVAWNRLAAQPWEAKVDLFYLENRKGAWSSPHLYGMADFNATIDPFCHRDVYESMIRLPVDYRQRYGLLSDVVARAWPELASITVQQMPGLRGYARRFTRWLALKHDGLMRRLRRTLPRA